MCPFKIRFKMIESLHVSISLRRTKHSIQHVLVCTLHVSLCYNMGRGHAVTDFERGQIQGYIEAGYSERAIAKMIQRTPKLVRSCVNRGIDNPPGTSTDRKRKLGDGIVRQIRRHASNTQTISRKIKEDLHIDASAVTVYRRIVEVDNLVYTHLRSKPNTTREIEETRRAYAIEYHTWTEE